MRQVYASTACVPGRGTLEDLLWAFERASLRFVELGSAPRPNSHNLAEHLTTRSQRFVIHNYFPRPSEPFLLNLAAQDPAERERSLALCRAAIDLSAACGADFYSVHAGFRADIAPDSLGGVLRYTHIWPYDTCYRTFVVSLRELVRYARPRGIGVLVEPNVLTKSNLIAGRNELALICDGDEVCRLMDDVSEPNVGILLDTGHLNVTAHTLDFDRDAFIDEVGAHVRALHVHDNDGTVDSHDPVGPRSWILELLTRPGFCEQPIVVEARFPTVAALSAHVAWLHDVLAADPPLRTKASRFPH